MKRRVTRRSVLRGLLGGSLVTVGLPPLACMMNGTGTAYASGLGFPKRFGLFYWGNGNVPDRWTPLSEGAQWEPSDELMPLLGVRDLVTVVTGTEVKLPNLVPHGSGASGFLSGMAEDPDTGGFLAPSVDQRIAQAIGGATLYPSLVTGTDTSSSLSYAGVNSPNPAEYSPYALFERIFGAGFREPGEDTEPDPSLALRRSVLDSVMEDAAALQSQVGYEDRLRLEQHLDGVRELELRLARLEEDPPDLEACERPEPPLASYPYLDGRPQLSTVSRAICDLLVMALACDQTRVFAHFFSTPVNDLLFPGISAGHHDLTHNEPGDQPQVHDITVQIMEEYAYLVDRLASVPEGEGTLLDSCAVLATSEVSLGRTHSISDLPILIAGSAGGALRQGVHYHSYSGDNASKVIVSLMRALDINAASYGEDEAYTTDGLSGIEV
ncbi:MAG: DUF1552 domain-containing protein [Alphaproteobacteria bacterium]|nr:DUF1552 domain-containing protein [Alphaproteobacteria bacterium]